MKRDVTLVVLTAGIGKRFMPFQTDKTLFPFLGKKLIDFAVPKKLPPEVVRIVVVANERNKEAFMATRFPVPHVVVVQEEANGMAGAILAAKNELHKKAILVVIGDDVADEQLTETVLDCVRPDVFGVLVGWKPKHYFPGGYLVFRENRPVGIKEKPGEGKTPSDYVYFGGQYIADADRLIDAIEAAPKHTDDVYEQALTGLMAKERFVMVPYERDFVSLKYPWHVLDMTEYLLHHRLVAGRGKHVEIRNNVSIEGTVYLGNNVKIFENTKIVGPVYIGDNTIVGNNNIIRDSIIGEHCVTGFNTDITRSYIGDNCWFHSNYVGDSILEGDVSMGSGCVLANLRLDEGDISSRIGEQNISTMRTKLGAMIGRGVRIGVNTSVMPGIKIGANSLVGAGILLDSDLPADSFCIGKSTLIIKKNTRPVLSGNRDKYKSKI
jgi:NDP-sugar pyrophosphorylase family protein